jgi:hypothetical protein
MELNREYWTDRYLKGETGWDIGYASPALIAYMEDKPRHVSILIPGAGNAYEAQKLWEMGFHDITVADISEIPLLNLKKRIPEFPEKHLRHEDFFNLSGNYDFILEQTFFCALNPDLREAYAEKMAGLLNPKGELAGLLFDAPMNTDYPPYGGTAREYRQVLGKYLQVLHMATCHQSIPPRAGKEVFFRATSLL